MTHQAAFTMLAGIFTRPLIAFLNSGYAAPAITSILYRPMDRELVWRGRRGQHFITHEWRSRPDSSWSRSHERRCHHARSRECYCQVEYRVNWSLCTCIKTDTEAYAAVSIEPCSAKLLGSYCKYLNWIRWVTLFERFTFSTSTPDIPWHYDTPKYACPCLINGCRLSTLLSIFLNSFFLPMTAPNSRWTRRSPKLLLPHVPIIPLWGMRQRVPSSPQRLPPTGKSIIAHIIADIDLISDCFSLF